jgi:hypothetical protein
MPLKYSLSISLIFFLFSCETDDAPCLPPPQDFQIDIQDSMGDHLLGTGYFADSIQVVKQNGTAIAFFPRDFYLVVPYREIPSEEPFFLRLDASDQDTLWIKWSTLENEGGCGTSFIMDSLRVNNRAKEVFARRTVILEK